MRAHEIFAQAGTPGDVTIFPSGVAGLEVGDVTIELAPEREGGWMATVWGYEPESGWSVRWYAYPPDDVAAVDFVRALTGTRTAA